MKKIYEFPTFYQGFSVDDARQHNKRQVQYMAGHKYITSTEMYELQELETLTKQLSKHYPLDKS